MIWCILEPKRVALVATISEIFVTTKVVFSAHKQAGYRMLQYHHLFAQYAEMNSKICSVPDRKSNSFSSNNCP